MADDRLLAAIKKAREIIEQDGYNDDCPLDYIDDVLATVRFTVGDLRLLMEAAEVLHGRTSAIRRCGLTEGGGCEGD